MTETPTPAPKKRGIKAGTKNALKADDKKATAAVTIRLTPAQKDLYMAYAEHCGLSLTKIILNLLNNATSADKFKI